MPIPPIPHRLPDCQCSVWKIPKGHPEPRPYGLIDVLGANSSGHLIVDTLPPRSGFAGLYCGYGRLPVIPFPVFERCMRWTKYKYELEMGIQE